MLVKVLPEDLMHCQTLAFNLYSSSGLCHFTVGQSLNASDLQSITETPLYRCIDEIPSASETVYHEGLPIRVPVSDLRVVNGNPLPQLVDRPESEKITKALSPFLERLKEGVPPDVSLCMVARNQLISAVNRQVEHLQYISQLRVRDDVTYSHVLDVTALSIALAMQLDLGPKEIEDIALAAMLHDLGKLMIPYNIMFKQGKLTEKEFQVMQLHPGLGYDIITQFLKLPEQIARPALEHQEMYGGGGYPNGLSGDEIHLYSHIVKIADVYDALTSARPYKRAIPHDKALAIMLSEGSQSFHPKVLEGFVELGKPLASNTTLDSVERSSTIQV